MDLGAQLELIRDALLLGEDFELYLVVVASAAVEQRVVDSLAALPELAERGLVELDAIEVGESAATGPVAALLAADPRPRLTVLRTVRASRSDPAALDRCLAQLNPRRDVVAARHRGPLIISCRPDGLRRLVERAPDLFSIHAGLIVVEHPPPVRAQPSWLVFDHERVGLLGLDPSFALFEGSEIPSAVMTLPPAPADAPPCEPEATALAARLFDDTTRVVVSGPDPGGPWWLAARAVADRARAFERRLWLDGSFPAALLVYDLVRLLDAPGCQPPLEREDLERRFGQLTSRDPVLIVVEDGGEPLPAPARPSKLVEVVHAERAGSEGVHVSTRLADAAARPRGAGYLRSWEELLDAHEDRDASDRAQLWRLTRGLLDQRLPASAREAAERRWRSARPGLVDAALAVSTPGDRPRFMAALAELRDDPDHEGVERVRAIQLGLQVGASPRWIDAQLERLASLGGFAGDHAHLRLLADLRRAGDRSQAIAAWLDHAILEPDLHRAVLQIVTGEREPVRAGVVAGRPRLAFVEALGQLHNHTSESLAAAGAAIREAWPAGAPILDHIEAAARCWLELGRGRWELARLALDRARASAAAWADPHALLRTELLALAYHRWRGDLVQAAAALGPLLERVETRLGPHTPTALELRASGIEIWAGVGQGARAGELAEQLWQRLDYVARPSSAVIDSLSAWFEAQGADDRVATLRARGPRRGR